MGRRKENSHSSPANRFPILTHITKSIQVRGRHRRGERSAKALTQSHFGLEITMKQRSWPSLSHTATSTRVRGHGQEVSLDTHKITLLVWKAVWG